VAYFATRDFHILRCFHLLGDPIQNASLVNKTDTTVAIAERYKWGISIIANSTSDLLVLGGDLGIEI
jgi:hypothetical protein